MNFERAQQLQATLLETLQQKQRDYGSQNIEITGLPGIAVRLQDKVSRLINLTKNGVNPNFESVDDTLLDIGGYALIGQLLRTGDFAGDSATGAALPLARSSAGPRSVHEDTGGGRMAYLAGPIDAVSRAEAVDWREAMGHSLADLGWSSFSPATAVQHGSHGPYRVMEICRSAVQTCDILIAHLPSETPAFGTIREIEYAISLGKPVAVWSGWVENSLFSTDLFVSNYQGAILDWVREQWSRKSEL